MTQADAAWMPNGTNLRWHEGKLEGLFFVLATADEEQKELSLAISSEGAQRMEKIADINPISEAKAERILASDPTWFSIKGDLRAQRTAATRSLAKFWVPITAGQPVEFKLRQGAKDIAVQSVTPTAASPIWFRAGWDAKAEDPILHGQLLFPHNSLMVRSGAPVALTFDLVGAGTEESVSATLTISVRDASAESTLWQKRDALSVKRKALSHASVALPTSDWQPGNYEITAEFQDAAGKFVGSVKRGLMIVPARPVASRFGATYKNMTIQPSVYADPAEEPAIFKVAREYHATHTGPETDVVVSFDGQRDHIVFSRLNRGFTPFWFVNELGIDWEWVEGHDDQLGSLEVQYDPECRYARASIVASTPARAIVHWRYNTTSRFYDRFFDEWVDEFYYIYPDQTIVRKIMGYFRRRNWHETFEPYLVGPAGLHLSEVFEDCHLTWMNLSGAKIDLDPINMWKDWHDSWMALRGEKAPHPALLAFNLRGGQKFFYSFADMRRVYSLWSQVWGEGNSVHEVPGGREQPFPQDTEKPLPKLLKSQISSYCLFDVHAALLEARSLPDGIKFTPAQLERETNNPMSQTKDMPDVRIESTWAFLLGLGNQVDPVAMTQAWVAPAMIENVNGAEFAGYESSERAYRFRSLTGEGATRFTLRPQSGKPQVNPVMLIDGLTSNAPLSVNFAGRRLAEDSFRVGFESQADGTYRAIIWMRQILSEPTDIAITRR